MRIKNSAYLFFLLIVLSACGNATGLEEETEYESFRDTINNEEFTGFAYLLRNPDDAESNVQDTVNKVFEENGEEVYFLNLPEQEAEKRDLQNEDSKNPEMYFPSHRIAFIKEGNVIDEFDIDRDDIHSSENQNEFSTFIQMYQ